MARNYSITKIIVLLTVIQAAMCIPDAKEFFAKSVNGNLTKITWAHAVNSKAKLEEALGNDDVMMLEADVNLGTLTGSSGNSSEIPIMVHPPETESDLSLDDFLETTLANQKKGIKLDFKSIEAFDESRPILEKHRANMSVPVWLNADIISGPVDADNTTDAKPVEPKSFLAGAATSLPNSTLSIGWTTRYGPKFNITSGKYTEAQIKSMVDVVGESKTKQSITYPVRAGIAANDIAVFSSLLKDTSANNPTLTIWSSENDTVDTAALSKLIKEIGVDKVYVDVPKDVWAKLDISAAPPLMTSSIMLVGSVIANFAVTKLI